MASGHGAVNGYERVVFDHYKSPNGDSQREPNGDIVDHNAEVRVEPQVGSPSPGVLLELVI